MTAILDCKLGDLIVTTNSAGTGLYRLDAKHAQLSLKEVYHGKLSLKTIVVPAGTFFVLVDVWEEDVYVFDKLYAYVPDKLYRLRLLNPEYGPCVATVYEGRSFFELVAGAKP